MTSWMLAWLWQGLLLTIAVSVGFHLFRRINASTRYVIWWSTFAALLWLGWSLWPHIVTNSAMPAAVAVERGPRASAVFEVVPLPQSLITSLLAVWMLVTAFKLVAIFRGLLGLYRLKRSCCPVSSAIEAQLPLWLEIKGKGRTAQLMTCSGLPNAAVLGLNRPYVVFPPRLLEVVSASELDQILLHEYGHVQRRDDWARLIQTVLEAPLWMHPAAYWIGHALNLEREVACDDWVVSTTGAARAYAGCLSRVAHVNRQTNAPALVPGLFGRTPDVLRRVDRLLMPRRRVTRAPSFIAAALAICTLAVSAGQLRARPLVTDAEPAGLLPRVAAIVKTFGERVSVAKGQTSAVEIPSPLAAAAAPARSVRKTAVAPAVDTSAVLDTLVPEAVATRSGHVETVSITESRFFIAHPDNKPHVVLPLQGGLGEQARNSWQITGITIGTVARKASVTVADTVAKASVSIAKSF
jgi:beta-lactamase regulating signal transducer with metallopeptidase domain